MKQGNAKLDQLSGMALDTIREILEDPNAPASVRLRAAKLVIDNTNSENETQEPEPKQPSLRPAPKIGRNDYCPCGSGLKYKRCCLLKSGQTPIDTPLTQ